MRHLALLLALLLPACTQSPTPTPTPPTTRLIASPNPDHPALRLKGLHDRTLDFADDLYLGSPDTAPPDQRTGVCLFIENCQNLTIRHLTARGYKIAILARNSPGLTIDHCTLSDNYRQHLKSTPQKEDESDWMSYHHNEANEWLRYGGAIYLDHCPYPTITWNTVHNGQSGLLMRACDRGLIHSNDFSYNSALGIGCYRCAFNAIMHNALDFNVRGYSHGVYSRGQDSAAILLYESSHNNLIAYNSATHSGDGLFLWAGQTTMDTGWPGCNDNLIYGNDFSHAPCNGVEATFSRNYIISNAIDDCAYAIWAGYAYGSVFLNNRMENNATGIAIEHGQHNTIAQNGFLNCATPIHLWANPIQDATWAYPRHRDTASHDYLINNNVFLAPFPKPLVPHPSPLTTSNTTALQTSANLTPGYSLLPNTPTEPPLQERTFRPPPIPHARPFPTDMHPLPRSTIHITEWGPSPAK